MCSWRIDQLRSLQAFLLAGPAPVDACIVGGILTYRSSSSAQVTLAINSVCDSVFLVIRPSFFCEGSVECTQMLLSVGWV
jgi:hypothetical protein